jgi:AraC-like DNA-binding protein
MLPALNLSISPDRRFDALQQSAEPVVGHKARYETAVSGHMHSHPRAQLIRAVTAPTAVRVGSGQFLLQPGDAAWLPGSVEHSVSSSQAPIYHSIYVRPDLASDLPRSIGVLRISSFLGELMRRVIDVFDGQGDPATYPHLAALLLSELKQTSGEKHHLPMPEDRRLLRICHALSEHPGDRRTLADWARLTGASRRMLERRFQEETGMSFAEWREICRVRAAIPLLEARHSVQQVAWLSGYDSPSAFAAMFRKVAGVAPASLRGSAIDHQVAARNGLAHHDLVIRQ